MHVRDLDTFDHTCAGPDRERSTRFVRVDVHLQRLVVADDEQRIAELLQLVLDRLLVEAVTLDHERCAIAVARELLVDCFDVELFAFHRGLGQWLTGNAGGQGHAPKIRHA